jgi:carbonic anhydrase
MHGPSEHRLDGKQYDLEIHIVHELVDGPAGWKDYKETLAVVGVLFKEADYSHPFIEKLRPLDFGLIEKINFAEMFDTLAPPKIRGIKEKLSDKRQRLVTPPAFKVTPFYHYKGSLTNPPCADVVNWIVHKEVLPIRRDHLEAFKKVWFTNLGYGNYRECQHLCGRRVVRNFHLDQNDFEDQACLHGKESEAAANSN